MIAPFQEEYQKRLAAWSDIQEHLPFLYEAASKSKVILELGVRSGVSTAALLAGIESQMEPACVDPACPQAARHHPHLWSVDISRPHVPDWWRKSELWTFTLGNDLYPAVANEQPAKVDMLFIDTSHFYEHTLEELALYVPRVNPGGIVCCHDTELPLLPGHPKGYVGFSVARALDKFCLDSKLTWTNYTGSNGLGVIRIPSP